MALRASVLRELIWAEVRPETAAELKVRMLEELI